MCLITLAWKVHPRYKLVLVANRDEFYNRPTAPLGHWHDHPDITGGRDIKEGGTWMGLHRAGRFAAITNYRDPTNIRENAPSRGLITRNFLLGNQSPAAFFEEIHTDLNAFNGFNLLMIEGDNLLYFNNIEKKLHAPGPGVYGLSNAFLDTPWPKLLRAKAYFQESLRKEHPDLAEMTTWMQDSQTASDECLPSTGLPKERERQLSAMCIRTENYGTCSTSALMISYSGEVVYTEKSYATDQKTAGTVTLQFQLQKS